MVAVSDEGPWCGSGINDSDEASVTNAATIASQRNVLASVILASGFYNAGSPNNGGPPLMEALAVQLANATGGTVTRDFVGADLVEAMKSLVRDACIDQNDCNDNQTPDACELAGNDCNGNGRLDSCENVECNEPPEVDDATRFTSTSPTGPNSLVFDVDDVYTDTEDRGAISIVSVSGGPADAANESTSIDQVEERSPSRLAIPTAPPRGPRVRRRPTWSSTRSVTPRRPRSAPRRR